MQLAGSSPPRSGARAAPARPPRTTVRCRNEGHAASGPLRWYTLGGEVTIVGQIACRRPPPQPNATHPPCGRHLCGRDAPTRGAAHRHAVSEQLLSHRGDLALRHVGLGEVHAEGAVDLDVDEPGGDLRWPAGATNQKEICICRSTNLPYAGLKLKDSFKTRSPARDAWTRAGSPAGIPAYPVRRSHRRQSWCARSSRRSRRGSVGR